MNHNTPRLLLVILGGLFLITVEAFCVGVIFLCMGGACFFRALSWPFESACIKITEALRSASFWCGLREVE